MKLLKCLIASLTISASLMSNAAVLTFQGSNVPGSSGVTMTNVEARAAWESALFSFTVDGIDGATGDGTDGINTAAGNTYSDVGNGSNIFAVNSSELGAAPAIRGLRNGAPLISFDVDFSSPVNAVGFDVLDNDGGGMQLILTDANTGVETLFDFTSTRGSRHVEFFGVIFDPTVFVSSLRVGGTDPGGVTTWDNFSFGIGQQAVDVCIQNPSLPQCINVGPTPAPAPASLALIGLGIAGLALRRRVKL